MGESFFLSNCPSEGDIKRGPPKKLRGGTFDSAGVHGTVLESQRPNALFEKARFLLGRLDKIKADLGTYNPENNAGKAPA
jgi:hypothetical protein